MNKIHSRTDCLLDQCYYKCFVCGTPFDSPPRLDRDGRLAGRGMVLEVIIGEYGIKEDTEERICDKCWVSDLSRFNVCQSVNQDQKNRS